MHPEEVAFLIRLLKRMALTPTVPHQYTNTKTRMSKANQSITYMHLIINMN